MLKQETVYHKDFQTRSVPSGRSAGLVQNLWQDFCSTTVCSFLLYYLRTILKSSCSQFLMDVKDKLSRDIIIEYY